MKKYLVIAGLLALGAVLLNLNVAPVAVVQPVYAESDKAVICHFDRSGAGHTREVSCHSLCVHLDNHEDASDNSDFCVDENTTLRSDCTVSSHTEVASCPKSVGSGNCSAC